MNQKVPILILYCSVQCSTRKTEISEFLELMNESSLFDLVKKGQKDIFINCFIFYWNVYFFMLLQRNSLGLMKSNIFIINWHFCVLFISSI